MAKNKKIKSPKHKVFTSPGSLEYIGKEVSEKTVIKRFRYDASGVEEVIVKNIENCFIQPSPEKVLWLDVDGVHDLSIIEEIGRQYKLHPLLLEDVLNTTQKAKLEFFEEENQLFVVMKTLHFDKQNIELITEQVSIILGENFIISFQEQDQTDNFEPIHKRIKVPASRTRRHKADYLLYVLIDLIVDNYYLVLEDISEHLDALELNMLTNPTTHQQNQLYALKREMTFMRKAILPLRDMISSLIREESDLVGNKVNVYLRDVLDHAIQTLETLDTYRDIADNIMANYHSALSNKMNQVMKTLTVFTAIFMPLTFIAGIYGMNFENMPELRNPNGYFYTLVAMILITIALWIYFKWKKYI